MHNFDTKAYSQLVKNLRKESTGLPTKGLVLLADTATQLMSRGLRAYAIEVGINLDVIESEYDQIDLQVLNPASEIYDNEAEFILIYKSALKLRKKYYSTPSADKAYFAEHQIALFKEYLSAINGRKNCKIILCNFLSLPDMVFNNYGNKLKHSWAYQSSLLNLKLMDLAAEHDNVFICNLDIIQSMKGRSQTFDPQVYIRTDIALSLDFFPSLCRSIMDVVLATTGKFNKCLILDLDNTTWGGIIGDDGLEKIQLGTLGLGKAFTELQLWAKSLKERGIILAICSKNTESVAKEPFEQHPDMILRLDDISVFVANWENKADNIRYIQQVLNIGFDSMVFLDDNPFERNLVRQELPEVTVPELPEDPAEYIPYLQQFNLFETASYSALDSDRTKKYQEEAQRAELKQNFTSVSDYLTNLNMVAKVSPFDEFNVPRIAQLTQRSNQFNLRTVRYTEKDIKGIIEAADIDSMYISLADKYGDYGLISLVVLEKRARTYFIDTWIMSCRVLKRDVEKFVLNKIIEKAKANNIQTLIGERIPTKKNVLVEDHYRHLGFTEKDNLWSLDISSYKEFDTYITIAPVTAVV